MTAPILFISLLFEYLYVKERQFAFYMKWYNHNEQKQLNLS